MHTPLYIGFTNPISTQIWSFYYARPDGNLGHPNGQLFPCLKWNFETSRVLAGHPGA